MARKPDGAAVLPAVGEG